VVDEIDFWPYNIGRLAREDEATLEAIPRRDRYWVSKLDGVAGPKVSICGCCENIATARTFDGENALKAGSNCKMGSLTDLILYIDQTNDVHHRLSSAKTFPPSMSCKPPQSPVILWV
jgi:hypothetical protein